MIRNLIQECITASDKRETTSEEVDIARMNHTEDAKLKERIEANLDVDALSDQLTFFSRGFLNRHETNQLIRALAKLVIELEEKITQYDTVLSDDASGRLVTLFLVRVINKKKDESNLQPVKSYFISGGANSEENNQAIDDFLLKSKSSFGKVLLVSEYIVTGSSLTRLANRLTGQGIDFDVAVLSISPGHGFLGNNNLDKKTINLKKRLKYGEESRVAGDVFYNKIFNGVVKSDSGTHPVKRKNVKQSFINNSRRDMEFLADEIYKLIEKK